MNRTVRLLFTVSAFTCPTLLRADVPEVQWGWEYKPIPPAQVVLKAVEAMSKQKFIHAEVLGAHYTLGWNDFADDIPAEFRKAGELTRAVLADSNLSPQVMRLAHWLFAWVLASEGDFQRALREADATMALAPFDGIMSAHLAQMLIPAGEIEKGMQWNEAAGLRDPGGIQFQNYTRGLALRLLGKNEESIAAFKKSPYPNFDTPLHVAIALVRLARFDEAKDEVKLALKTNPKFTGAVFESTFFYRDPSIPKAEIVDLAKAGLPEK